MAANRTFRSSALVLQMSAIGQTEKGRLGGQPFGRSRSSLGHRSATGATARRVSPVIRVTIVAASCGYRSAIHHCLARASVRSQPYGRRQSDGTRPSRMMEGKLLGCVKW
jgi:hypothetical protein